MAPHHSPSWNSELVPGHSFEFQATNFDSKAPLLKSQLLRLYFIEKIENKGKEHYII